MSPKVIVITGASSGIGAELARQLGAQGHRVVLAARGAAALQAVADEVGGLALPTDVTVRAQVLALRDAALKAHGRVDVWVNNAGQGISRAVLDLSDEDLDAMMAVNVKSALYGMQAIVPQFQAQGAGHLINVSSFLARVPLASVRAGYNAAKAALNALTANLRMDLAISHPGIKVSVVMPGLVSTAFGAHARGAAPGAGPAAPAVPSQTPQEVAAAMVGLIAAPRGELITNPALVAVGQRYIADVDAFEAGMRLAPAGAPGGRP
jgi:NADP-dependent 3-hydroxy acid dehydrogenase YdfG